MEIDLDPNPLYALSMAEADRLAELAKGRTALDVGANIGGYVHWLLEKGFTSVYAFEPVPGPFNEMLARYADDPRVITNNLGISDRECTLNHCKVYNAWTISNESPDENVVPGRNKLTPEFSMLMTTIDNHFDQNQIGDLGFVKIDVDGGELKVLKGARQTLLKFKPPILFEVSGLGERYFNDTRQELAEFIINLGYMAVSMDGKYAIDDARELRRHIPFHTTFDIMLVPRNNRGPSCRKR